MAVASLGRVVVLLGAGSSIPAGMPSTEVLTKRVLSGEDVVRHSNSVYCLGRPKGYEPDRYLVRVVPFLAILRDLTDAYHRRVRAGAVSYEDLYYLARQVHDADRGEQENPAVDAFNRCLRRRMGGLLKPRPGEGGYVETLPDIAMEAASYIHDLVADLLGRTPSTLDHLGVVIDLCNDPSVEAVDVFTLNHDALIETCLRKACIRHVDGFSRHVNGVRYWRPALYDRGPTRVRLFKLHGSINWYRLRPPRGTWADDRWGIPLGDLDSLRGPNGRRIVAMDHRPGLLVGTFNKMLEYTRGPFAELYARFHCNLMRARHLIICGYGFGDRGINNRILDWLYARLGHRLVVVDPDPSGLRARARAAVSMKWTRWEKEDRVRVISSGVESVTWPGLRRLIRRRSAPHR